MPSILKSSATLTKEGLAGIMSPTLLAGSRQLMQTDNACHVAGDFIVVKWDIEGNDPEEAFMKALLEEDLGGMVAELFYELHFGEIFIPYFKLEHTPGVQKLYNLRASGLRVHYWP